ncbi:hypothetical protein T4C_5521 [Trichinella pseudospiralis]|uniref:Uncharacterized protein n=1 Tax=Trichinella pseudospiralis TaxID=6337 RepID=A0A0V1GN72_TRIPS|nr:hypothetical protein T4C_5521 [Trichinella pseudospiralis]
MEYFKVVRYVSRKISKLKKIVLIAITDSMYILNYAFNHLQKKSSSHSKYHYTSTAHRWPAVIDTEAT